MTFDEDFLDEFCRHQRLLLRHPQSSSESSPQRQETRLPAKQKQLRATASTRATAGPRAACNLTSCSRHSRHASSQEPHSLPELPSMKQRREEMEIAEFYRRQKQEKVDKAGVVRLYEQECDMSLAKLMRAEAAKERQRRKHLLRAARVDILGTSSDHVTEALERRISKAGVPLRSNVPLTTSMCPC
ncbi:uncharacterized protein LOC126355369 [Schistocerca gregaria]|uniref:uncharacterized protein LOC126355369 n=1 Tax=Schistocerca gregaria TaxID=7010 RepID=UPI00211E8808|nr:uncharacterized protein LOC126355369 [Schistocerca gregaria]